MKKTNGSSRLKLRVLTTAAMLAAVSVVVGITCKNFLTFNVYYRITFENFPIIIAGLLFGPAVGGMVGVAADIVSCLCSTNPALNPLITLGAATVGIISGIAPIIFRTRGKRQVAFAVALSHIIGQVAIKSVAKILWFGMPWVGIFIGIAVSAAVGVIEYFLIDYILNRRKLYSLYEKR